MTHEEQAREIVKRMADDHPLLDDVPDRGWMSIKAQELEQSIAAALEQAAQEAVSELKEEAEAVKELWELEHDRYMHARHECSELRTHCAELQAAQETTSLSLELLKQDFTSAQMYIGQLERTEADLIEGLQAAQPGWTTERPMVAGWYWWKDPQSVPFVMWVGDDMIERDQRGEVLAWAHSAWAGPLRLPREA